MAGRTMDFTSLEQKAFPITVRAFRLDDEGEEVWVKVIKAPCAFEVPPLKYEHGPIWMRFEYADGEVVEVGRGRITRALISVANRLRGR